MSEDGKTTLGLAIYFKKTFIISLTLKLHSLMTSVGTGHIKLKSGSSGNQQSLS